MAVGRSSAAKSPAPGYKAPSWGRTALAAACLVMFAAAVQPVRAQDIDPGKIALTRQPALPFAAAVSAYDRGEYAVAREIWLPWAHRGDPAAQRNLAHIYRMGLGVAQDFTQAAAWYRRAADAGLSRAQANLAAMYLRGQGVGEDAKQAAYWFTVAAANGHALAQYNLALLYLRGEGVERSEAKAAGWLYRAAQAGHKPAMRALAKLVAVISGPAGPPDPPPARPETGKRRYLDRNPLLKEAVKRDPVKQAAAPAPEESVLDILASWITNPPAPSNASDPDIVFETPPDDPVRRDIVAGLAALHAEKFSTAKNRWQPLAEGGHAEAQYQLGKLYLRQGFSDASKPQGFFWLTRAAAQRHPGAKASRAALDGVMSQDERLKARQLLQAAE
ncbi:MAG: tetratricopeptide repeat protein [Alphaproteobacteria bacterium]